jgi:hypothetical protein
MNEETRSYKVEVLPVGESKWCSNGMRYATSEQAEAAGKDLFSRWMGITEYRVAESTDEPNQE